jgi:hypothetical protein
MRVCFAIGLADFVPNFVPSFLTASSKNTPVSTGVVNSNTIIESHGIYEDNAITADYCNTSNPKLRDSIFCNRSANNVQTAKVNVDTSNVNTSDYSYKGAINTTAPNLNSLQTKTLQNAINNYNGSYMLSINPSNDVNIGIGANVTGINSLKFNIKY